MQIQVKDDNTGVPSHNDIPSLKSIDKLNPPTTKKSTVTKNDIMETVQPYTFDPMSVINQMENSTDLPFDELPPEPIGERGLKESKQLENVNQGPETTISGKFEILEIKKNLEPIGKDPIINVNEKKASFYDADDLRQSVDYKSISDEFDRRFGLPYEKFQEFCMTLASREKEFDIFCNELQSTNPDMNILKTDLLKELKLMQKGLNELKNVASINVKVTYKMKDEFCLTKAKLKKLDGISASFLKESKRYI